MVVGVVDVLVVGVVDVVVVVDVLVVGVVDVVDVVVDVVLVDGWQIAVTRVAPGGTPGISAGRVPGAA